MSDIPQAQRKLPAGSIQFGKDLVDHAVLCWENASENAERLARRRAQVLSVAIAVFGLGLYRIQWFYRDGDRTVIAAVEIVWAIKLLLIGGLLLLLAGAAVMLGIAEVSRDGTAKLKLPEEEGEGPPFSSHFLKLSIEEALERPATADEDREAIYTRIMEATYDLESRVAADREAFARGMIYFSFGLLLIFVAIIVYLVCSVPPLPS